MERSRHLHPHRFEAFHWRLLGDVAVAVAAHGDGDDDDER